MFLVRVGEEGDSYLSTLISHALLMRILEP